MAVPFRRTSKTAKRLRRTHFKLNVTGLVSCPHCGAMVESHHVCQSVVTMTEKKSFTTRTNPRRNKDNDKTSTFGCFLFLPLG